MNNSIVFIGLAVLLGLGGVWYYTMNQSQVPVNNSMVNEVPPTIGTEAMMEETVTEIKLEAGSFYFKPNTITVKKGEKVKIVMNAVSMMHDFNIDELNVKMPIVQNGETGSVEFTPNTVGTFEYYCSVGQHRANGQVGTIIVE